MRRAGCALVAFALLVPALAAPAGAERIREFAVEVWLDPDGSFAVEERIVYDFEGAERHGIYRDVPVRYQRAFGARYHLGLDVEEVTGPDGQALPYRVSRSGDDVRIRIGDPQRTVTGVHAYRIRYRVRRAILFFEEHDELYWNATGSRWQVPIDRARADVYLPQGAAPADVRLGCFTGPHGSLASDCAEEWRTESVRFEARRPFRAGEGLSIVVGIPKGILREPSAVERLRAWLGETGILWLLLPLGTLLGMHQLWRARGRDPGAPDAVPVRYEPPEGLSPAEVGTLADERADLDDVTATILDLAVRGYLSIEEVESQSFLFLSTKDYRLRHKKVADGALKPHERRMLSGLFEGGPEVLVSALKNRFYKHLPKLKEDLYQELSGPRRYFPVSPEGVRRRWAVGGGALAALGVATLVFQWAGSQLPGAVAVLTSGAVVLAFSRAMPRRTRRGRQAHQEILGFQEFVRRVDADRLERMGGRTAERFERVLPFAVVLGVADAWADAFADIYTQAPSWYVAAGNGHGFHPRSFVGDVGRSLGTIGRSLASTPGGSGRSGFSSGGGSSGGGFGGGGGGSW